MKVSIILQLDMEPGSGSTNGAGWYVSAIQDGQRVSGPTWVEDIDALRIASQIDQSNPAIDNMMGSLVHNGNQLIAGALKQQLEFAEQQASQVKMLRLRLQSIEEKNA